VDAYRGFVMLLMMGEVLGFGRVAAVLPGNGCWAFLARQQEHVAWTGCTLHDMIQPSFSFLVGVALPFSLARRSAEGQARWRRTLHAFWRAFVLVLLGVFYLTIDIWNRRAWAYPLVVVGMNSIAAYLIAHLWSGFISSALTRHLGRGWIEMFGKPYEALVLGAAVLAVEWAILAWMSRHRIFLRV